MILWDCAVSSNKFMINSCALAGNISDDNNTNGDNTSVANIKFVTTTHYTYIYMYSLPDLQNLVSTWFRILHCARKQANADFYAYTNIFQ